MSSSQTYLFAQHISTLLDKGESLDWKSAQKIAKEFSLGTDTEIMQACELAVVLSARKIAHNGNSIRQQYEELKDLYERQVTIRPMDTKSRVLQQYSTPCPLSFLLGTFVNQNEKLRDGKILEPSAGNGLLTIACNPEQMCVNELDEVRIQNLRELGFYHVSNLDSSNSKQLNSTFQDKSFRGLITNPPFAKLPDNEKIERNGWAINTLDYKMSVMALDKLADNGRAAIIVGGKMWNAYWKPVSEHSQKKMLYGQWKTFLGYLYAQYNVVDVIYVDGENIYRKQGTQYPIAIILIDGRHEYNESNKPRYVFDPTVDYIIQTYDQLFDRIHQYIQTPINNDKQKQAKALMLKIKMSKSNLSYLPPHIFKNLGLGDILLVGDTSRELLRAEYGELRSLGDAISKKSKMYKNAYEWTSELVPEHFSSAFTAALMVQQAGFPLPKIKAISTTIPERGVGGMYTVSPYFRKTTIQLSTSNYFKPYGGLEPAFEESYRQHWNSTPNCALHELCHHIAFLIDSESNQMNRRMTELHKNNARQKVSGYARQKYCEFCAETISGILYGIKYPDYIIDYLPEGNYGTTKEQEAFKKLKEIGREKNTTQVGSFIPEEILHHLDGVTRSVTPLNFDTYEYNEEQKRNTLFSLFEKIKFLKQYYETNSLAHCAVNNWCKVMNKTFDFMLPIDMKKVRRAKALLLQMKMAEVKYQF